MSTMNTIHDKLRRNIKYFLKKKCMTMEALAIETEVDKSHISRIMSSENKASLDLVQKIADVFEVKVDKLFR